MQAFPTFIDSALDAINRSSFWWGLAGGACVAIVASLALVARQLRWTIPPLAGIAGVVLALMTVTAGLPYDSRAPKGNMWLVVLASAVLFAAAYLPRRLVVLPAVVVSASMALVPIPFVASSATTIRAATALATFGLALALDRAARDGGATRLFPPLALAAVGMFLCLPETTTPLVTLGFLVPLALWSASASHLGPRLHAATGMALAPPLVTTVMFGVGSSDRSIMLGAFACLATVAVWPAVRLARRSRPGPPRMAWPLLAAGVAAASIGISRLAVVRSPNERTAIGALVGLGALAAWCYAGEVLAERRARKKGEASNSEASNGEASKGEASNNEPEPQRDPAGL